MFSYSALPTHVESMYNVLVASTNETRGLEHNRFIYLVLATELSERELNTLIKHNLEQTPYQLVIILIPGERVFIYLNVTQVLIHTMTLYLGTSLPYLADLLSLKLIPELRS